MVKLYGHQQYNSNFDYVNYAILSRSLDLFRTSNDECLDCNQQKNHSADQPILKRLFEIIYYRENWETVLFYFMRAIS